jgi:hypothetical protein
MQEARERENVREQIVVSFTEAVVAHEIERQFQGQPLLLLWLFSDSKHSYTNEMRERERVRN